MAYLAATATAVGMFVVGSMSASLRLRPLHFELARARWDAEHDPLTGLANRAGLRRRLETDHAAGRPQAAILLDLDAFKKVNDTWGHQAGDALLVAVAERLTRACGPTAGVGRLGGDEFLVLLPWTDRATAIRAGQAILAAFATPIDIAVDGRDRRLSTTVSVGIAGPSASWSSQLGRADTAMYKAKSRHRYGRHGSAWTFADEDSSAGPVEPAPPMVSVLR